MIFFDEVASSRADAERIVLRCSDNPVVPFPNTPTGIEQWLAAYPDVLGAVWHGFESQGQWPIAVELTRKHALDGPRVNFLAAAREMPAALGRAQLSTSAVTHAPSAQNDEAVVLRPFALTFVPAAHRTLAAFGRMVQVAVGRYLDPTVEPQLESAELGELLSVDDVEVQRLEQLVALDSWLFRAAGGEAGSLRIAVYDDAVLQIVDNPDLDSYFAAQGRAWWPEPIENTPSPPAPKQRERPSSPPPELLTAASMHDVLLKRAAAAEQAIELLIEASAIETFRNDPNSGFFMIPANPFSWQPLDRTHIPLLGDARERGEAWLRLSRLVVATAAPEHLDEFDASAASLRRVYLRGASDKGPPSGTKSEVIADVKQALSRRMSRSPWNFVAAVQFGECSQTVVAATSGAAVDEAFNGWLVKEAARLAATSRSTATASLARLV